ncbi:DNA/RNA polymerase [Delitschia confertaspora ATCC 74209]|uniref:DNA-directed RNA polymerase n=1 Tax=Delitschia confertaspora ATCC 74209 TaxID=1513339 RepID=A0A9P4JN63_9PLEO|nr:DNA/RNA polymerase [Delitschia confertaspora ATCC 74209]
MLARAARRKLRRDAFRPSPSNLEQLTLPWLCPAQMRWAASARNVTTGQFHDSRIQKIQPSLIPRFENRSLATSADVQPSQYAGTPFEGLMQSWTPETRHVDASRMPSFNPSRPLIIHASLASATPQAKLKNGIGGDPAELHQNLHACLRVGRTDRAAAIVQRLTDMYQPSAAEVVNAHNVYLQGLLEAAQNTSETSMEDIESWYEKEMVAKAIQPNGQTLVTLLRASMALVKGTEQNKLVRKYLHLVQGQGPSVFEEVNSSPEFSDEEWDTLIRAQPDIFEEPPSPEELVKDEVVNEETILSTPLGRAMALEHGLIQDKVKPVAQKGSGLKTLQNVLSSFEPGKAIPFPHEMEGTEEEKARAYAYMRQIELEKNAIEAAVVRWKQEDEKLKELGIHGVFQSKPLQAWMWQWYSSLLPVMQKEMAEVKQVLSDPSSAKNSDERLIYGPYLELGTPEKLSALAVQCTLHFVASGRRGSTQPLRTSKLASQIGNYFQQEISRSHEEAKTKTLRRRRTAVRKEMLSKLSKGQMEFSPVEEPAEQLEVATDPFSEMQQFPPHIKARIGALVIEKLLQTATITVTREDPRTGKSLKSVQPAFSISSIFNSGKKIMVLTPHYDLHARLRTDPIVDMNALRLPMLVEPKPWTGYQEGGYYTKSEPVVRTKSSDEAQRMYAISAIEKGDMSMTLAGLDVLGRVPWQINKDVFEVILEAWNKGDGVGGLVPEDIPLERPAEPAADAPWAERARWMRKMKEYENAKSGFHSQKCFQNFQLEIGRAYLNETFYYPHNLDFRGRAYPIPPILNHIGADLARGMLKFGKGKELGTVGLQWLKVHLANLYGYDKASLKDREHFTMEHIQDIYDSATNPLTGKRWWASAEDPWQCLACCIELKNALDSPDPAQFVSHLPVHQDGTCNGLQHYAALGGDRAGATQVNLEPGDKPQDIYTGVAELVREAVAEDAKAGDPVAQFLDGKITRKVVKRTVMTNVYGVTFQGAKLQVYDELKPLFPNFEESRTMPTLMVPAAYIAAQIFNALAKIFNGARDIQDWLGQCCTRITTSVTPEQIRNMRRHFSGDIQAYDPKYKVSKQKSAKTLAKTSEKNWEFKSSVIWTTPLKMPVVQPYRDTKLERVKTSLQTITIVKPRITDAVSKRKQLQAFPPNFIHSLDASHMILSALKCEEEGLTFAAVHDSFWTHAADVPTLSIVLRDAFVRMHSEDIIGRLAAEFEARYSGSMYRAVLKATSSVAKQIAQWRRENLGITGYRAQMEATFKELAMEADRQELLKSEDPEERKKGEAMVTPTSIFFSSQDSSALEQDEKPTLLGQTSTPRKSAAKNSAKDAEIDADVEAAAEADIEGVEDRALSDSADLEVEADSEVDVDIEGEVESKPKKKLMRSQTGTVWLPLTFPAVPEKGDWDVRRLKESKYFFS